MSRQRRRTSASTGSARLWSLLALFSSCLFLATRRPLIRAGRIHVSFPPARSFQLHADPMACADIIALFVVGVLLVLLFVTWQHYLERRLENPGLPRTRWTAPPLMKPSMWPRAHGRFAGMQTIACVNWAAFTIWIVWVQLYYQTYLNLSPIHTMLRL